MAARLDEHDYRLPLIWTLGTLTMLGAGWLMLAVGWLLGLDDEVQADFGGDDDA